MKNILARFVKDQSGATAIEYGLIAALVSIAIIGGLTTLGGKLSSNFNNVSAQLKSPDRRFRQSSAGGPGASAAVLRFSRLTARHA